MREYLKLGEHYVSDFLDKDDTSYMTTRKKYSLNLCLDESTGAIRLVEDAPNDSMWGKYWYRSGTNITMNLELKNIVDEIVSRIKYINGDIWLDIACNDGTLLSHVPYNFMRVGIDPCDNSYLELSQQHGVIVQDYFSYDAFQRVFKDESKKAKVITTIAMFYDIADPDTFIKDILKVLDKNGVWVLQMSYTPLMLRQLAFDNICHEHRFYYSLTTFKRLMNKHNLKIVDCELNDVNGGSFRVYVQHNDADIDSFATAPLRDVCQFRINSLLAYEKIHEFESIEIWQDFQTMIDCLKERVVSFIKQVVSEGKTVYGYGASTKGNTLLQYFGLDNTLITAIADRSPYKYGMKTIGTNIPIISEAEMRKNKPDYLLVLPWHFIKEFTEREHEFIKNGGKFIVPCPEFKVI